MDLGTGDAVEVATRGDKAVNGSSRLGDPVQIESGGLDVVIIDEEARAWRWRTSDETGRGTLARLNFSSASDWGDDHGDVETYAPTGGAYNIYVVEDACAGTSPVAHDAALSRMVQAGAVRMTAVATVLEFQRDWANRTHYSALMDLFREHGGGYGVGIEYAYTMVHHAPQSAQVPHVVTGAAAH